MQVEIWMDSRHIVLIAPADAAAFPEYAYEAADEDWRYAKRFLLAQAPAEIIDDDGRCEYKLDREQLPAVLEFIGLAPAEVPPPFGGYGTRAIIKAIRRQKNAG